LLSLVVLVVQEVDKALVVVLVVIAHLSVVLQLVAEVQQNQYCLSPKALRLR
jgi:hypothetical protein